MITALNTVIKVTANDLSGHVVFDIKTANKVDSFKLSICFKNKCISQYEFNDSTFSLNIAEPQLWSVNHPNLYYYHLEVIANNEVVETVDDYFGIRKISTKGKYITINDLPIFIKGYIRGATAHDHNNNLGVSEEEFYRKNIKAAKSFGFNLVRFHSQIPSEVFFKVADEEGLLVHIEMRPPHDLYNNLEEMISTRNDFISEEFIVDTIAKLYNHPSLLVYCLGNEIKNLSDSNIVNEVGNQIKKEDPTRLFLDTCAWGENGRPLVDIDVQHMSYYFPFGKHQGMYDDVSNLMVGDFNKGKEIKFDVPLIAHEVCHYTALRDFKALKDKFIKYHKPAPWWIDEELKMIHEKGFDDEYIKMYHASKLWQLSSWKIAFEEMRRSSLLGGFHFLQFADTDVYENSNGVVDCFDDVNYLTPEQFLEFNGDLVLSARFDKYNFYDEEEINVPIYISRFDELDVNSATLRCALNNGTDSIDIENREVNISKHDLYLLENIKFVIPYDSVQKEWTLSISLEVNNRIIASNSYKIWGYPKQKSISYKDFISYESSNVVVTNDIKKALSDLEKGKNVCLVYRSDWTRHVLNKSMPQPEYAFQATWNRFKPVIWDRGTNYGGYVKDKKLEIFGYKNNYLINYCCISEDCDKIIINNLPFKVTNLICGIDKSVRDRFDAYKGSFNLPELMYDRTLRDFSYLFEVRVGKGNLLVTGFNLLGLDDDEPSSNYFANFVLKYLETISPKYNVTLDQLTDALINFAKEPVKERMMTQFWEMDDTPVETKQYWEDARKYLVK